MRVDRGRGQVLAAELAVGAQLQRHDSRRVVERLTGVIEPRAVPAHPAVVEVQRAVLHEQLIRHELFAGLLVAGDHARDGLAADVTIADANADAVAYPEALAMAGVLDVDLDRSYRDELARLPRPREMPKGVAAQPAGEDALKRGALLVGCRGVEIQRPRPRRAGLVVAVAAGQCDRQPGKVGAMHCALLDQPRQHAHAHAVRGAPARPAVDPAARTDRVAVAGLEIRAADAPAHRQSMDRRPAAENRSRSALGGITRLVSPPPGALVGPDGTWGGSKVSGGSELARPRIRGGGLPRRRAVGVRWRRERRRRRRGPRRSRRRGGGRGARWLPAPRPPGRREPPPPHRRGDRYSRARSWRLCARELAPGPA